MALARLERQCSEQNKILRRMDHCDRLKLADTTRGKEALRQRRVITDTISSVVQNSLGLDIMDHRRRFYWSSGPRDMAKWAKYSTFRSPFITTLHELACVQSGGDTGVMHIRAETVLQVIVQSFMMGVAVEGPEDHALYSYHFHPLLPSVRLQSPRRDKHGETKEEGTRRRAEPLPLKEIFQILKMTVMVLPVQSDLLNYIAQLNTLRRTASMPKEMKG